MRSNNNNKHSLKRPTSNWKLKQTREAKWKSFSRKWKNVCSWEDMSWKRKRGNKLNNNVSCRSSWKRRRSYRLSYLKKKQDKKQSCWKKRKSTTIFKMK